MPTPAQIEAARLLILQYGWNATTYQLVNPGIDLWFSAAGDAVVGYVRRKGFRVVAGAPVCSEERLEEVIEEWESATPAKVCYFGAAGRVQALLDAKPGHSRVTLGSQPVWSPSSWPAIISGNASLRAQLNRARNKGVAVQEWSSNKAEGNPELRRVLEEWLSTRGLPPLHFLVEPETLHNLQDRRVFVAEQRGKVVGFLVASPIPVRKGWLTEQFIRGKDAPNGTVELMVDFAVRAMEAGGSEYVTMGLVPLSGQGNEAESHDPAWLKALTTWVCAHGRRFYNFGGLEAFKAKFRPDSWEPIYACTNEPHFSFRALYAIAAAFTRTSPIIAILKGMARAAAQEVKWLLHSRSQ